MECEECDGRDCRYCDLTEEELEKIEDAYFDSKFDSERDEELCKDN